jgi:hypothetical protein
MNDHETFHRHREIPFGPQTGHDIRLAICRRELIAVTGLIPRELEGSGLVIK